MPVRNGWTGGQYSLFRAIFGVYLLVHFVHLIPWGAELFSDRGMVPEAAASPFYPLFPNVLFVMDSPAAVMVILALGAALSVLFVLGAYERIAGVGIWYILACLFTRNPLILNPGLPFVGWLLLAHAFVPPRPFGSWNARNRIEQACGWRMPDSIHIAGWVVMSVGYTYSGLTKLASPSWLNGTALLEILNNPLARPTVLREILLGLPEGVMMLATWAALGLEIGFAFMALIAVLRPWLWLVMFGMHFSLIVLLDFSDLSLGMVMMHLFTFNPAWVKGAGSTTRATLFYDGSCGLCHRFIRFLLSEDREGRLFRFAPLESDAFRAAVPEAAQQNLPDSLVLMSPDGAIATRSRAVIAIGRSLGGAWKVIALGFGVVPRPLRDAAYDLVARVRHRLFARPEEACPVLPPELRKRFD